MTSSLFVWECKKLLTPLIIAAVVLLLAVSAYTSYADYTAHAVTSLPSYERYLKNNWFGEFTDEKEKLIRERSNYIDDITSMEKLNEMIQSYLDGDISKEEYDDFMSKSAEAAREGQHIKTLAGTSNYLRSQKDKCGIAGWFIPTERIARVVGRDVNIWRLAAVILIFARMFTPDYAGRVSESGFASILYTTKRGRRASFYAKMSAAVVISLLLSVLFEASDLCVGIYATENFFEIAKAPLFSIERYAEFNGGVTIGAFIMYSVLIRMFSTVVLAF